MLQVYVPSLLAETGYRDGIARIKNTGPTGAKSNTTSSPDAVANLYSLNVAYG